MKTIWKQIIEPNSIAGQCYAIEVPARFGSVPLHVGIQYGKCCVWFEADPDAKAMTMLLYCVGTGFGAVPEGKRFIGTVIDGQFVWHFYAD